MLRFDDFVAHVFPRGVVEHAPLFDVVVADPPWSFADKGSRAAPDSGLTDAGYTTMDAESIRNLVIGGALVRDRVAADAALFLWTTWTHILNGEATATARAWGFEPKVVIPWIKVSQTTSKAAYAQHPAVSMLTDGGMAVQIGMGHYVRGCSEPLILATRGSKTVPGSRQLPGVIVAPRSRHSAKPAQAWALVHTLYPDAKGIELFTRGEPPPGWWCFGHEATGKKRLR